MAEYKTITKMKGRPVGYKQSNETRLKISLAHKGKKKPYAGRKSGFKHSEETKGKMRNSQRKRIDNKGPNSHWWKGGISNIHERIRTTPEYKLWRKSVFERDKYTCVWCKQKGGQLNADHIKPFCDYPELRFAIDNGRTLCIECHRKTDTWGVNRKTK